MSQCAIVAGVRVALLTSNMLRSFPSTRKRVDRIAISYGASFIAGFRERSLFGQIETYCMFVGYARSGHSLVGSLLDAHPDIVIAHELDALGFIQNGFSRSQLYALILNNSRAISASGREQTGYTYEVPGQWQGRFRTLQVIGDKRGHMSTARLQRRPELIDRLERVVRDPVRLIHVVRNPFDNISTIAKRRGTTLEYAAERYFSLAETVSTLRRRLGSERMMDLRHESLIEDPRGALKQLCGFLNVAADDAYLDDCARVVFASPHRTRFDADWSDQLKARVATRARDIPFLADYHWDD